MKRFCLIPVALIFATVSCADSTNKLGGTNIDPRDAALSHMLPAEYATYKTAAVSAGSSNAVCASLLLVAKAKELVEKTKMDDANRSEALRSYRSAWRLAIRAMAETPDVSMRQKILLEWDNGLNNTDYNSAQIYALFDQWDRRCLTPAFWSLLERTQERKDIASISYVLYGYGDATDATRLLKKRKQTTDIKLQEMIQNAINYINYRLRGDLQDPGPASAPPREE